MNTSDQQIAADALSVPEETIVDACGDPPLPELGVIEQNWETDPIAPDDVATHAARAIDTVVR